MSNYGRGFFKDSDEIPKPQSLKELPKYIKKFFYRLYYIFKIVWDARPWILALMIFMALFNGVAPLVSAFLGANLLTALANAYQASLANLPSEFPRVMGFLIAQFSFMLLDDIINSLNRLYIRIANELVGNQVTLKILHQAKTVDLASFDRPEFYEKFENASREASSRPIQITNATFSIISTIISVSSFIVILWAISPFAPVLIILLSIPSAIVNFTFRRKNFQYVRRHSKERRRLNYYSDLLTDKDLVKEIRILNLSDTFISRYRALMRNTLLV